MANENLERDMKACEKAGFGVNYGRWKATQPIKPIPIKAKTSHERTCKYCGKPITDKYNRNRAYCDDDCRNNAYYERHHPKQGEVEKTCERCGEVFYAITSAKRFCSQRCVSAARYYRMKGEKAETL